MKCGPDGCPIIAFSDLTPAEQRVERQRTAKKMAAQDFTPEQIAKQLNASLATIYRDLEFSHDEKIKPTKSATNPKGAGRPKGKRNTKTRTAPAADDAQKVAEAVLDQGKTLEQAAAAFDLPSVQHVKLAVAKEEGRREPKADRADLSLTAQQKFDAAIRQYKRRLDVEFEERCREQCRLWLNEVSLPQYAKEIGKLEQSIRNREGVMDRITYQKIRACLHPDRVQDPALKKRSEEAFRLFTELEKRVLDEKESPTQFRKMPRTYEELMAMKAKVQADRRTKRGSKSNVGVR